MATRTARKVSDHIAVINAVVKGKEEGKNNADVRESLGMDTGEFSAAVSAANKFLHKNSVPAIAALAAKLQARFGTDDDKVLPVLDRAPRGGSLSDDDVADLEALAASI